MLRKKRWPFPLALEDDVILVPDMISDNDKKESMLFCCLAIGQYCEVWMYRQLIGLQRVRPHLLTWQYANREVFPLKEISAKIMVDHDPLPANRKRCYGYRLRCLPQMNFYATTGKERAEIEQYVRQTKPAVILAQFGFMALRILPVAKRFKIPLVAHFHGLDLSSSLRNRWYRWSLHYHLRDFAAIVVVGEHQEQWLLEHGIPANKIHRIPCGVPTAEFDGVVRGRGSEAIRFIAVSRLVQKKGLEYTLRAFDQLRRCVPNARLDIYGDGPLEEPLKALARELGLGDSLCFAGAVTPEEVRRQLAESDVFVQHSIVPPNGDSEGSPVATAEAAAAGLPIVSTVGPGIVDQVVDGETGLLVAQRDVQAMAEKMLQLAGDAELRVRMGQAGRRRMRENFDTQIQIARLEDVLLDCISHD